MTQVYRLAKNVKANQRRPPTVVGIKDIERNWNRFLLPFVRPFKHYEEKWREISAHFLLIQTFSLLKKILPTFFNSLKLFQMSVKGAMYTAIICKQDFGFFTPSLLPHFCTLAGLTVWYSIIHTQFWGLFKTPLALACVLDYAHSAPNHIFLGLSTGVDIVPLIHKCFPYQPFHRLAQVQFVVHLRFKGNQ